MQISDTSGRFSSIFLFSNFMLFCEQNTYYDMEVFKLHRIIFLSVTRHNVLKDCLVGCFEELRQFRDLSSISRL